MFAGAELPLLVLSGLLRLELDWSLTSGQTTWTDQNPPEEEPVAENFERWALGSRNSPDGCNNSE
jgi:hypothetical protein